MTDYPVTVTNQRWGGGPSGGVSSSSDPDFPNNPGAGAWTWNGDGYFTFDFDPASAETVYAVPGIVGWRIDIHVVTADSGQHRLFWNMAFDNPGITATTPTSSYTAYGPEDGSPGSFFDITGPGPYSLPSGAPYFNSYADTPYEVLDRMRNGTSYPHGYGLLEGIFGNDTSTSVVLDDFQVVFYTADDDVEGEGVIIRSSANFTAGH